MWQRRMACSVFFVALSSVLAMAQVSYREIVLPRNAHPAVHSAAAIIARKLARDSSAIRVANLALRAGSKELIENTAGPDFLPAQERHQP